MPSADATLTPTEPVSAPSLPALASPWTRVPDGDSQLDGIPREMYEVEVGAYLLTVWHDAETDTWAWTCETESSGRYFNGDGYATAPDAARAAVDCASQELSEARAIIRRLEASL